MLGNRLKEIREIFDMSQRSLAIMLGVTHQTIRNYESGATSMSLLKACHYAQTLWWHRRRLSKEQQDHLYDCLKIYLEME